MTTSLDDEQALRAGDPGDMLRQVASAAAQVRQADLAASEAGLDRLADDGRPRAVIVAGTGAAGLAGDALAALCGLSCPVPVLTVRGSRLPGWVGAADVVLAVSAAGTARETSALAVDAVRRGCRLVCVGPAGSPLADIAAQGRAPLVPVRWEGEARAAFWALLIPLVRAARALRLVDAPAAAIEATAARLEEVSHRCRPAGESFLNPGKQLALDLAGSLPVIWGGGPLAGVAAVRFADQLAANAKYPALAGTLPAALHTQLPLLDGVSTASPGGDDFFRDRADETETTLRLVLLHEPGEAADAARARVAVTGLLQARSVPASEIEAAGSHPLELLASLIALADYATVYLALILGVDPTPVAALGELRAVTG